MRGRVIKVPTIEDLKNRIPEIIETSKGKKLYLDEKIIKQLRKNWDGSVAFLGKYNFFLADEKRTKFRRVLLIRKNSSGRYVHSETSKENIFIVFNQ